jgi:hypothetical protein
MPKEAVVAVVVGEVEQAAEPEQAGPPVALRVRAGQAAAGASFFQSTSSTPRLRLPMIPGSSSR